MMHVYRKIEQGINTDARSGGFGGGNLQIPHFDAPSEWQARVIRSDASGVTIILDPNIPPATEIIKIEGIPPETMTGDEF